MLRDTSNFYMKAYALVANHLQEHTSIMNFCFPHELQFRYKQVSLNVSWNSCHPYCISSSSHSQQSPTAIVISFLTRFRHFSFETFLKVFPGDEQGMGRIEGRGEEGNGCGKTRKAYVWKPQPRKHNVFVFFVLLLLLELIRIVCKLSIHHSQFTQLNVS